MIKIIQKNLYLTSKDITKMLQITKACLYRLIREGKFPQGFKFGGNRRWKAESIEEFLKEKETEVI